MRDLAREAERLGGQRVEVDRVVVAGHRGVAPAQVAGQLPHDAGAGDDVERLALGLGGLVAAAAAQVRRGRLPHQLAAGASPSVTRSKTLPLACGRRFSAVADDVERLASARSAGAG